jgi:hypothetical protein
MDHGSSGRGNNWAHGYFDDSHLEDVMEAYRRLVESNFRYDGCMMIHSMAGGTGSGLGSRLLSEIRDRYGKGAMLTSSFAPFASGETSVQNYNTLLSLNAVASNACFVGYFSNDQLIRCTTRNLNTSHHLQKQETIPLDSLNRYAARALAGFLLPKTVVQTHNEKMLFSKNLSRFDPYELIYSLTPMPTYRFCQFATSTHPERKRNMDSWEDITSELIRNIPHDENRACFSSKLIVRGAQGPEVWKKLPKMTERWYSRIGKPLCTNENDIEVSYIYGLKPNDTRRTLESCHNSKSILQEIQPIVEKAEKMYQQKAYLHWYKRYCSDIEQVFDESFQRLHDICDAYSSLSSF